MNVLLDTTDLGEVEQFVSAHYYKARLTALARTTSRNRVTRAQVGELICDDFSFGIDFDFDSCPSDDVVVCMVRAGGIVYRSGDEEAEICRSGEVIAVGAHNSGCFAGEAYGLHCDVIALGEQLLAAVAGTVGTAPVRLTAATAVSPMASAHLIGAIRHVKHAVLPSPVAAQSPLIVGNAHRYLAACVLSAFPSTAGLETTAVDRTDSTPVLLRRAIAFIEDNVARDISMVDIANAVYVTPRALQYMFRKHRNCTPTEYLRQVRLAHAHAELAAGERSSTTVADVAARWGFAHSGRFAVYYREQYGESPHATLRR
ncbi:MAG: helix-turn-helix domain-containing protein [Actinomycetota bacterium]